MLYFFIFQLRACHCQRAGSLYNAGRHSAANCRHCNRWRLLAPSPLPASMPPRNRRPAGQRLVSPPPVRLSGPPPHRLAPSALQQPRRLGLRPRGAPRALGRGPGGLGASAGALPCACRARPAVAAFCDVPVMNKPAAPWRLLLPPGSALESVCLHASACEPASHWAEASLLQLPMPLPGASRADAALLPQGPPPLAPSRLAPSALQQPRRLGLRPRGAPPPSAEILVASAPRRARPGHAPRLPRAHRRRCARRACQQTCRAVAPALTSCRRSQNACRHAPARRSRRSAGQRPRASSRL
jgi:hypothetical protein